MPFLPVVITKSISAGTSEENPIELARIPVDYLVLHKVYIDIPSGWQYSAGIRIKHTNMGQILPVTAFGEDTDNWITGDDSNYEIPLDLPLSPGELVIEGVNNTDYDQPFTITLIFYIED